MAAVPRDCPPFADESVGALVCRSVAPAVRDRGAAYYVVLAPGSFFDPTVVVGKGTSHGSPYVYDRTVPLLVRAPGRVAAGGVASTTTFNAFVDTAAELLGIAPPHDAATGASLATPPPRAETRLVFLDGAARDRGLGQENGLRRLERRPLAAAGARGEVEEEPPGHGLGPPQEPHGRGAPAGALAERLVDDDRSGPAMPRAKREAPPPPLLQTATAPSCSMMATALHSGPRRRGA